MFGCVFFSIFLAVSLEPVRLGGAPCANRGTAADRFDRRPERQHGFGQRSFPRATRSAAPERAVDRCLDPEPDAYSAGANDYRTVDLTVPNEEIPGYVGIRDAWLGLYFSFDGGQSWKSTLLPGFLWTLLYVFATQSLRDGGRSRGPGRHERSVLLRGAGLHPGPERQRRFRRPACRQQQQRKPERLIHQVYRRQGPRQGDDRPVHRQAVAGGRHSPDRGEAGHPPEPGDPDPDDFGGERLSRPIRSLPVRIRPIPSAASRSSGRSIAARPGRNRSRSPRAII